MSEICWEPTNRDEVLLHLPLEEAEQVLRALQKEEWALAGALLAANTRKQLAQAIRDTRRWSEEAAAEQGQERSLVLLQPPYVHHGEAGYLSPAGDHEPTCRAAMRFLRCSRALGHAGDHAAHGPDDQMMAHWPPLDVPELHPITRAEAQRAAAEKHAQVRGEYEAARAQLAEAVLRDPGFEWMRRLVSTKGAPDGSA